jgi:hypothetical protein
MKHLIEKLKEQIANSIEYGNDLDAASWGMQEGVLITANEARQIVEALEGKAQLPSFEQIIDFATWYSGMEREKVERAYDRYLRDVLGFSGDATISKTETVETQTNWISVEDSAAPLCELVWAYDVRGMVVQAIRYGNDEKTITEVSSGENFAYSHWMIYIVPSAPKQK